MDIGWLIASAIAKAVQVLLHAVKFNEVADRAGITGFVRDMGLTTDASGFMANLAKWFIRLIVLVAAFDALGLPSVSAVLNRLLFWLPNLVVALVVLVIAGLLATALSRIVRGAATEAGLGNPNLLAMLASWAVWAFAIMVALDQIGVAATLVNTLFMGVVAALALAFGLGGRDTAGQIVSNWYLRSQRVMPQIDRVTRETRPEYATQATGPGAVPAAEADGRMEREQRPTAHP